MFSLIDNRLKYFFLYVYMVNFSDYKKRRIKSGNNLSWLLEVKRSYIGCVVLNKFMCYEINLYLYIKLICNVVVYLLLLIF